MEEGRERKEVGNGGRKMRKAIGNGSPQARRVCVSAGGPSVAIGMCIWARTGRT